MNATIKINNVAPDADRYIVARLIEGELWYWGSWEDKMAARRIAHTFDNGIVVERETDEQE